MNNKPLVNFLKLMHKSSDIIKEIKEVSTDGKESKKLYRRI